MIYKSVIYHDLLLLYSSSIYRPSPRSGFYTYKDVANCLILLSHNDKKYNKIFCIVNNYLETKQYFVQNKSKIADSNNNSKFLIR